MTISSRISGITFVNELEKALQLLLKGQLDMLKDMGLSSQQIYETRGLLENAYEYLVLLTPSIIIMFSAVIAYLNSLISILILRKQGYGITQIPKLSNFKLPDNIIPGFIVIFIGVLILKYTKVLYYETIIMNVSALFSFVLFLQGLSVIIYFIEKSKLHPIIKGIFIFLLIISIPISAIVSLIGFLDIIFDFRGIKKRI